MSTSATSPGTAPSGTAAQNLPRNFDGLQYIASHGDLIQSLGADPAAGEQHYLLFGEAERRPTDTFNEEGYLDRYPDLRAAFGDDGDAATDHYVRFGFAEGRTAPPEELPPGFSGLQYIASYDDLIPVLGADRVAGERHYLTFGQDEGRAADVFNEAEYFDRYPDLEDAFGGNADAAADHYIRFGFAENRSYNDPPVAEDDTDEIEEDGSPITVDVLANDTDPDLGDPGLTVASVDPTAETNGTVSLNEAGEVVYDLADQGQELLEGVTTTDSFEYTVRDSAGAEDTGTVTITITGVNDAPVAAPDTGSATEDGGAVTINVLANDTDVDEADILTIASVDTTTTTNTIGTATIEGGQISYDPGEEFQDLTSDQTATDTVAYTVEDEAGAQSTATVTVTVTGADEPEIMAGSADFLF